MALKVFGLGTEMDGCVGDGQISKFKDLGRNFWMHVGIWGLQLKRQRASMLTWTILQTVQSK